MIRTAVTVACLMLPLIAAAQTQPRDRAVDAIDWDKDKDKPESEAPLPPLPQARNLVRYDPGRPSTMQFYVDSASVSFSADGFVRYTSVAKGDGASENIVYEALNCAAREYKIYAYGKPDGTWSAARDPQWKPIRTLNTDGHRFTLYQGYFCPARTSVTSAAEAVDALRRGGHPKAVDFNANAPMPR